MRGVGAALLVSFVIAAFTPAIDHLTGWMGGESRIEPSDAIVILGRGGADADGGLTSASLRRLLRGIALYDAGLAPLLVLSGDPDEIQARTVLATGLGVPAGAILGMGASRTTREEGADLRRALFPLGRRRILLVADPVDMPRTTAVMERAGFTVLRAPTSATGPFGPESRLGLLRQVGIELVAWAYYRLSGGI